MKLFQGDNKLIYPFTVKRGGNIVDLTNATVELSIKNKSGSFKRTATITSATEGTCQTTLFSTDLSTHGVYLLQAKVTYSDGYVINGDMFNERVNQSLSYEDLPTNPEPPPTESGSVIFEDWTGGETVEIDTGITEPPPEENPPVEEPTDTTAPTVTANPNGGTFQTSQSVALSTNETAQIFYTLDGSTPTESSSVYSSTINLTDTKTIKFFAKDTAGNSSAVQSVTFTKEVAATDTTVYFLNPTNRPTTASSNGWKTGAFLNKQSVSLKEIACGGNLANKDFQLWSVNNTNWTLDTQLTSGVFEASLQADANGMNYAKKTLAAPITLNTGQYYAISVANTTSGSGMLYSADAAQRVNNEWIDNSLGRYVSTTPATGLALATNFVYDFKIKVSV